MKKRGLTTMVVHSDRHFGVEHGAIHKPIHTSVQYGFEKTEDLIGVFQGTLKGSYNYSRTGTPTTAALESKITQIEQGIDSIAFASGMGALAAVFLTLLRTGDHLVASRYVFAGTNSLFDTLRNLGIAVTTVDASSFASVEAALGPTTKMVFLETIANPGTEIPDLEAIGMLCKERGLLLVVDNTITSPALFLPRKIGAGLSINSLSKTIGGHGAALGGAVTDTGEFSWERYPNIAPEYRRGDPRLWGLQQLRKKALRDMGASLSSEAAHQIGIGAETLTLRVAQSSATALAIAQYLEAHPAVKKVKYPGLESHPQYQIAKRNFAASSWLLSFELSNLEAMIPILNRLRVAVRATGMGDARTLVIPVAPTIYWESGPETRAEMNIADGLVRMSVGLEEKEDLIGDLDQALHTSSY